MKYLRIKVDLNESKADFLYGLLLDFGISGFETIDDKPVDNPFDFDYEELKPNLPDRNGEVSVVFYPEEGESDILIKEIQRSLPEAKIIKDYSDEFDWRDKWKDYFHAFSIGDIYIRPSWEASESEDGKYRHVIEIDPGVSFGTGSHETTRMCIAAMAELDLTEKKVMDAGCGSGILSIAANRLGSSDITCVDIDPVCITTTKENLEKNGCPLNDFKFFTGDIMSNESLYNSIPAGAFDVVVANILADIIVTIMPRISPKIKSGGKLITSGIIEGKENLVINAMKEHGFVNIESKKDGEWFMVRGEHE